MNGLIIVYTILLLLTCFIQFYRGIKINFTSLFFFLFLLFYGPAFIEYNSNPVLRQSQVRMIIIMCILLSCFFLSNKLLKLYLNNGKEDIYHYNHWIVKPIEKTAINKIFLYIASSVIACIICLGLFVYGGIESLKIAMSSSVISPDYLVVLRAEAGTEGWIQSIYAYAAGGSGRFVLFLALVYAFITKNKIFKYFTIFLFLMFLLAQISNLMKSGAIFFLVQAIALVAVMKGYKFNISKMLMLVLAFLALFIGVYLTVTVAESADMALEEMAKRVFFIPTEAVEMYTSTWPDVKPHTYGMNIRLVHNVFGHGTFESADAFLCGLPGCTFNAIFVADAWVDFSYIGVIIECLFLGVYLAFLDYLVFKRKTIVSMALFPSLLLGIIFLVSIGLMPCMITYGLLTSPILAYIFSIRSSNVSNA